MKGSDLLTAFVGAVTLGAAGYILLKENERAHQEREAEKDRQVHERFRRLTMPSLN